MGSTSVGPRGRVVVTGTGHALADGIAAGLSERGAPVTRVGAEAMAHKHRLAAALAGADGVGGPIDGVVCAFVPPSCTTRTDLVDVEDDVWASGCEAMLTGAVHTLQAASEHFGSSGGSVVLVVPTLAMSGGRGFTMLASAAAGQRGFAKSIARQWGHRRIRVNCLAVEPRLLGGDLELARRWRDFQHHPPALGPAPDQLSGVVDALAFLLDDASGRLTGTTMTVDGGSWMPA